MIEKSVEQQLHAEVVGGAAEINGSDLTSEHALAVEALARAGKHFEFVAGLRVDIVVDAGDQRRIVEANDFDGRFAHSTLGAFKQMKSLGQSVVNAAKLRAVAERPIHWKCADAEHALQFVEKRDRIFRRPIALVHEGENRNAAPLAHFKELARLRLDALTCVDDHDRGVDGGEHAIGVFAEILVARRIEEIDAVAVVVELQNRRRNRDAALLLELHPVRRRRALIAACRH